MLLAFSGVTTSEAPRGEHYLVALSKKKKAAINARHSNTKQWNLKKIRIESTARNRIDYFARHLPAEENHSCPFPQFSPFKLFQGRSCDQQCSTKIWAAINNDCLTSAFMKKHDAVADHRRTLPIWRIIDKAKPFGAAVLTQDVSAQICCAIYTGWSKINRTVTVFLI